jgi:phytoene dehydrogenase-like protein
MDSHVLPIAKAGCKVLVIEKRKRIGGACTLEPWKIQSSSETTIQFSPCAYLIGLFHPLVMKELEMERFGFQWYPAHEGLFFPFEDGTSLHLRGDKELCDKEILKFGTHKDVTGYKYLTNLIDQTRDLLRPEDPDKDIWVGRAPTRDEIEHRLKGNNEAKKLMFEWSMNDFVEHYLDNEKFQSALLGQGVIGTNASPFTKGTAYVYFHHACGRMGGTPGQWAYVKGGMGNTSFILGTIAEKSGATIMKDTAVSRIVPGEYVELEDNQRIYAPVIVSNADPNTTLKLIDSDYVDSDWRKQVSSVPMTSATVKINAVMKELPNFITRPGTNRELHYGQVNTTFTKVEWQECFDAAQKGELYHKLWSEIYFQTAIDPSIISPQNPGIHTMSIFSQYVPHTFESGDWNSRRDEVGKLVLNSLAKHCSNIPEAVIDYEVLGPPDVEERIGLHGGHIFQGEILPDYMWDKRLTHQTPMKGLYLCGAG